MAKTAEKKRYERVITPVGVARYPRLNKADEMDDKYKLELELSEEDAEALLQRYKEVAAREGVTKLPYKVKDGAFWFTFKSKKQPTLKDSRLNVIPEGVYVRSGSRVRVVGALAPYTKHDGSGLSAYLYEVQVIEMAEGGGGAGLTPVDGGYVAVGVDEPWGV